jgi:hypothetical protein
VAKKKKRGYKPKTEKKTKGVEFSRADARALEQVAWHAGKSFSAWARDVLLRAGGLY